MYSFAEARGALPPAALERCVSFPAAAEDRARPAGDADGEEDDAPPADGLLVDPWRAGSTRAPCLAAAVAPAGEGRACTRLLAVLCGGCGACTAQRHFHLVLMATRAVAPGEEARARRPGPLPGPDSGLVSRGNSDQLTF